MDTNYIVYQIIDPRNGSPFYVGAGGKKRARQSAGRSRLIADRIKTLRSLGLEPVIEIIAGNITEEEAFNFEALLIDKIGTMGEVGSPLLNRAKGGRVAGKFKRTVEEKENSSKARTGIPKTEEHRKNLSRSLKGRTFSEEWRRKLSEARRNRVVSKETGEKISKALAGIPKTEAHRKSLSQARKGKALSEAGRLSALKQRKKYKMMDPQGNSYIIIGLIQFCVEHGLNPSSMCQIAKGRKNSYKGWKCCKIPSEDFC